jgi:hypothetical protein
MVIDLKAKTRFSELHTELLNLCLELHERECSPEEAIQKILLIADELKMWL